MRWMEYKNEKDDKTTRLVEVVSVFEDMQDLEDFQGTTQDKIYEAYYELKRRLKEILLAESPKTKPGGEPKK